MGKAQLKPKRVVFDTNVAVSALLFSRGKLAWLRLEWQSSRIVPLVSRATAGEIISVLSYPKFRLSRTESDELLGDYLPYAETVEVATDLELPLCEDERDQMFIELAAAGEADALVTGDAHLLDMADRLPFEVLPPAEFGRRLDRE